MSYQELIKIIAAIGGGVLVEKIKNACRKKGVWYRGELLSEEDVCARLEEKESRIKSLTDKVACVEKEAKNCVDNFEEDVRKLRTSNINLSKELEVSKRELKEAKQLSIDYFPSLLRWIQKTLGKYERRESSDNIKELESVLSEYGLTVNRDCKNIPAGFICVRDAKVTAPEISLPALFRGDYIELKGIVKVPMSYAGANPPVANETVDNEKKGVHIEAIVSREVEAEPIALGNKQVNFDDDDDFIMITK